MRERIQTAIENRVLDALPEGKKVDRHQLQTAQIPPGIRHFLLKTLDRRSELEAADILDVRSQWFDVTDERFRLALQQAVHRLRETAHFPVQEWPRAMKQAVDEVLEYLIAPVPAVLGFIFREQEDSVTAQDLRRRAGFFSDYSYIGRAIEAYLDRKQDQRIARSEFSTTLALLDRKMTAGRTAEEWVSLISPLERLIRFGDAETNGIPVAFVLRFLQEKDLQDEADLLQRWSGSSRSTILTLSTFKTLFEEAPAAPSITSPSLFEPPPPTPPSTSETATQSEEVGARKAREMSGAESTPPPPLPDSEPVPLWKRFQVMASPKADSPSRKPDVEPLWKQYQKEGDRPAPSSDQEQPIPGKPIPSSPINEPPGQPSADLESLETQVLGSAAARRKMFIRELFKDDLVQYESVLRRLSQASDWSTASRLLANEVFRANKVDIYCEPAVAFTNAVENRFRVSS